MAAQRCERIGRRRYRAARGVYRDPACLEQADMGFLVVQRHPDGRILGRDLVERLQHYFSTYKLMPGEQTIVTIEQVYGCEYAQAVLTASLEDYDEHFGR